MKYKWKLLKDVTLQIFNDIALYWELDGVHADTDKELKVIAQEAVKDLEFLLNNI